MSPERKGLKRTLYILYKENEFCVCFFLFWLEEKFLKEILQSESPKEREGTVGHVQNTAGFILQTTRE
jgi:hypothetical protein